MSSLEQEIYSANEKHITENHKLTTSQAEQVNQLLDSKLSELKKDSLKQQMTLDYFTAKMDPSKQNFDEACKLGAQVVEKNPALQVGLSHAENKPNFLYEIGIREQALQKVTGVGQQNTTQAQVLPNPQASASPYQGAMNMHNTQWGNMSEKQFLGALEQMGLSL